MRFKAAIFDLDGTLVSARKEYRILIMNRVFARFGMKVPKGDIDKFWFMHSRDTIINKWGLEPDRFWKIFWKYDEPAVRKRNAFVFDDVDYIQNIRSRGIKTAIYTGSRPDIAEMELCIIGKGLFDTVVIAHPENGIERKPEPGGAIECLRQLDVAAKDAVYVGNADEDILTARNADIFSVLIDRKEHKHVLKADMVIENLQELDKILC